MGTRGVFALIFHKDEVLLSRRRDGKGWNLPGGKVEDGETDLQALIREVREETGLDVEVVQQIGPPHVFREDTAVAYECSVVGGALIETAEAVEHRSLCRAAMNLVTLVGPEGRLGRMGRMAWDGLSILQVPESLQELPEGEVVADGYFSSRDGCSLFLKTADGYYRWPRLDPYSSTGKMEPVVPVV